jgi:hypothetical protein
MNKNLVFSAGIVLMGVGAFDLFLGLSHQGVGEDAFASIAQSFMLLFPGWVFVAYSLQKMPRLSSLGQVETEMVPVVVEPVDAAAVPVGSVVVPFPQRSGRVAGATSAVKVHGK